MKLMRVELEPRATWTVAFGVCCCSAVMSVAPVASSRSALIAETATGTSFRASSRRRAVTMISSTELSSCGVASWAMANVESALQAAPARRAVFTSRFIVVPILMFPASTLLFSVQ